MLNMVVGAVIFCVGAINDTYSNGIIAEDKMIVLINLLLIQLIKDMILGKFDNKYILNLPGSIYSKKNKFDNVLKTIISYICLFLIK